MGALSRLDGGILRRAELFGERFQRPHDVLAGRGERVGLALRRAQRARLVGVSEEGDRRLGADQHEVARVGEGREGVVDRVGEEVDGDPPRPALHPRVERLREETRAGLRGDATRQRQARFTQGMAAHKQDRGLAGAQDLSNLGDCLGGDRRATLDGRQRGRPVRLVPGGVGGEDQGRDPTRRGHRRGHGSRPVARNRARVGRGPDPIREGPRDALDVGGERCVVLLVVGRVVADDVDHRRVGAPGVVHVGEPVGESWPQMQKGRSRPVRHARVAVGRARRNALEQPEHAPHFPDLVERRDEVHLRGARVGEADVHSRAGQRLEIFFSISLRTPPILGVDETVVSLGMGCYHRYLPTQASYLSARCSRPPAG